MTAATADLLDQFVGRARQLYTLPVVALRVLELTREERVDTHALKECIEKDPALTGKILRVVNSSLFGLSRQVGDLNQALALLGTKSLKLLVLGFSLPPNLLGSLDVDVLQRYWRHTLIKAAAARELSTRVWCRAGDEAFLAGLLQDIGQLVLIAQLGDAYVNFLDRVEREHGDLLALELRTLGFTHTQLSARLLDDWKLPPSLTQAVDRPPDPEQLMAVPAELQELPQILHMAELIAVLLGRRHSWALDELLACGRRYQGFDSEQLRELVQHLMQQVPELASIVYD